MPKSGRIFLYNTLESIYCLAQNLEDQRIAVMTNALGKLLRSSLNDKRDVITVSEDLQVTRDYLSIQQIRYGERLQVEYDFPQDILTCRIPAMTIQPLVENAIHHAAEKMTGRLRHSCQRCCNGGWCGYYRAGQRPWYRRRHS